MKRSLMLGLALAFIAGASSLTAQGIKFGVGGGMILPQGTNLGSTEADYGYFDKSGFGGGVNVTFPLAPVAIRVDGLYAMTNHKDSFCNSTFGTSSCGSITQLGANADVVYNFKVAGSLTPYVQGGLGLYSQKFKIENGGTSVDSSKTNFAYNFGAGVDFKLTNLSLFLDVKYVISKWSDFFGNTGNTLHLNFIPITVGVRF
jgi:opacity protein-like surface antigen